MRFNLNRLFLASTHVFCANVDDSVGIDVEGDLDLRHAARCRGQVDELELAERLVVGRHLTLALQHVNLDRRLRVLGRGEGLALASGDGGVALDEGGHDATLGLDAERQRGHVEKEDVLHLAAEHAGLDRRTDGNDLVGVHRLVGLLAGHFIDQFGDRRHTGRAADKHDMVDLALGEPSVLDRCLEGLAGASQQVGREVLELGAGQLIVEVQWTGVGCGHVRHVDLGRGGLRELDLGLLGRFLQALGGHRILSKIDAVLALEGLSQPVDDGLIPVIAAEVGVAARRLHLEDAVAEFEHRHVEGAATEVEHEDRLIFGLLVEAVGERRRSGLVDDAQHLEPCDRASFLCGGALCVVEVGRDGDHRLGDGVAQVLLGVALELHQRAGADLLGVVRLAVDVDGPVGADVTLDGADRALGVGDRLTLGDLTDEDFAVLGERHHRRGGARTLGVGDHDGIATFENGDDGVGRAEIDTNGLGHAGAPLFAATSPQITCLRGVADGFQDAGRRSHPAGCGWGIRRVQPGKAATHSRSVRKVERECINFPPVPTRARDCPRS